MQKLQNEQVCCTYGLLLVGCTFSYGLSSKC